MLDWFAQAVQSPLDVSAGVTAARMAIAFVFGVGVALLHSAFRSGDDTHTNGLGTTLILLTMLIAMVIYVIGENTARAFGLVGALSIIRFRTPIADTRDTAFVILAVALGMAIGAGYIRGAGVAFPIIAAACLLIRLIGRPPARPSRLKLQLVPGTDADALLRPTQGNAVARYSLERSATDKTGAVAITYKVWLRRAADPAALADSLRGKTGVQKVRWGLR